MVPEVYMMQAVSSALGGESWAGEFLPAWSSSSHVTVLICGARSKPQRWPQAGVTSRLLKQPAEAGAGRGSPGLVFSLQVSGVAAGEGVRV